MPSLRIRELAERDRRRLLMHFLELGSEDRRLRFGTALSDEALTHHVQHIDFHRDVFFGAYGDTSDLIGVAHLAFVPRDAIPGVAAATLKDRLGEAGLSVLESERGKGIGTALFGRIAMRCRSEGIDTIVLHCLADNQAMIHIARKAGMSIRFDREESDACLGLPPEEVGDMPGERIADFGDAVKQAVKFLRNRHR